MKKLLEFTILLIFPINLIFGQDNINEKTEHDIGLSSFGSVSGIFIAPKYSLNKVYFKFDIGLSIPLIDENGDKPHGIGQCFNVRLFPNKQSNHFNLFFTYNMHNFFTNKGKTFNEKYGYNYFNIDKIYYSEHLLGYGFEYKIRNIIKMFTSVTAGINFQWESYYDRSTAFYKCFDILVQVGVEYKLK